MLQQCLEQCPCCQQSLHSSEDIDNRQVSKYMMCPGVITSVKGKTRLRESDEKVTAVLDGRSVT